jgi:ABC-type glycerol-3-phosphate transport system permease component
MPIQRLILRLAELAFAAAILLLVLAPVLWLVSVSLRSVEEVYEFPITMLPKTWTLQAYRDVWLTTTGLSNDWVRYLGNTALVSVVVSLLTAATGMVLGYTLSRMRGPSAERIRKLFVAVQMVEGPVLLVPIYVMLSSVGLINSLFGYGLVLFVLFLPFTTVLAYGFALEVPLELDEAARIDGTTPWQSFWYVFVPVAKTSFTTVFLMTVLLTWGEYPFAVTLLEAKQRTVSTAMVDLVSGLNVYWNHMAAAAVIASAPVLLILILAQKHIVGGLTSGSLK